MTNQEGNSCCVGMAKFVLISINTIFFILGAAVTGLGSYVIATAPQWFHKTDQTILNTSALWGLVIFGAIMMVLAFSGCCGAIKGDGCCGKFFLWIYSATVGLVILAELVLFTIIMINSGKFDTLAKNEQVNKTVDQFDKEVNEYVANTYQACCVPKFNDQDDVCKALNQLTGSDGHNMCGADEAAFRKTILEFFGAQMKNVGIGAIICVVVEVIAMAAACHVIRKADAQPKATPPHDPNKPFNNQAHGGNLAYGTTNNQAPFNGGFA